jgi:hypothetical protein
VRHFRFSLRHALRPLKWKWPPRLPTACRRPLATFGAAHALSDALRDAVDVALDRGAAAARTHLAEANPLAAALDRQHGDTSFSAELAARRARLAELGD